MDKTSNIELFELDKVRFIIKDACDLDVAYAYDDLVFAEHGLFLIKFIDKSGALLHCWFNDEMPEKDEIRIFDSLVKTAVLNDTEMVYQGRFRMKQSEESSEQIDIEFENEI